MGNYAGSLRCKIHVIKRLNLLFFKRHKTQHKTINQILPVELGPICTSSLSFPNADPHPCEARPATEAHGCGLSSPLGNRCEFPDRLQNHTRSDSPSVIRPDLTQVETSDIKTHVFPARRSPGGAAASAHPECERFPVVSVRKGCVPGQGRWNNFLPLWAPKSWGCCL